MPLSAPQGEISKAIDHLRNMIADSATFRAWTNTANHDAALAKVHNLGLPPPANRQEYGLAESIAYRPYALVWAERHHERHIAQGAAHEFEPSGELGFFLEGNTPTLVGDEVTVSIPESGRDFVNTVGLILDDVKALAGADGGAVSYLAIETIELEEVITRADPKEAAAGGDFFQARVKVTWGRN